MSVSEQAIGSEVAGYRIESVIGRGGMAVVYRAEDTRLGRKVALKLLTPALSDQAQFQQRFIQESRLAASMDHPNIIPIYDAGNSDGMLFIAMRYVVGSDLKAALSGEVRLPPQRAMRLFEQIGDALDAAHELGLVHRDVKPGNVLLTSFHEQTDHVYLTDFGLTKRASSLTGGLTGTGHFLGTIDYVAPEQIAGKPVDARTDIYALGCVLYECLTGRVPFHRDDDAATLWAHLVDMPPPVTAGRSDLSPAVDAVIARAMAKTPDERYRSCHELVGELREALEVAAPVRGGRFDGRADTGPPRARLTPVEGEQTGPRTGDSSIPPGSFPPGSFPPGSYRPGGPAAAGDRPASYRPYEPEPEPGPEWSDDGGGLAGDEVAAGDDAVPRHPLRMFTHAHRWLLLAALVGVAALVVAAVVFLRPSGTGSPKLSAHYRSGQQFQSEVGPFGMDTPSDWTAYDDATDVDATLTPGGAPTADLFSNGGSTASWRQVADLIRTRPAKATGVWVYATGILPNRSSWQELQNSVKGRLPAGVEFDGGYRPRTVGGMNADEVTGQLIDPTAVGTSLRFVMDVVEYQTPALISAVWVVFFAPPGKFVGQQRVFDQVRDSMTFQ